MAIKAVGWANAYQSAEGNQLFIKVQVSIDNGTETTDGFFISRNASLLTIYLAIKDFTRSYAENVMGQEFGLLDTVRVFGATEILP